MEYYRYELQKLYPRGNWEVVASSSVSINSAVGNYKKSVGKYRLDRELQNGERYRTRTIKIVEEVQSVQDYE